MFGPFFAKDLSASARVQILSDLSRPVYLHFLDREMLTSLTLYHVLPQARVLADVRSILLATYEPLYFSAAMLFENRFARVLFDDLAPLFVTGHIELAIHESGLHDFVLSKRDQYSHVRHAYGFYYNDRWKRIAESDPAFRHKTFDTGKVLQGLLISSLTASRESNSLQSIDDEARRALPYLVHTIEERASRALTKALFETDYRRLNFSELARRDLNLEISREYVRTYILEFRGTIATGLSSGIELFGHLCPTFPYHHLPLWRQVYDRLGLLGFARSLAANDIVRLREDPIFHRFINGVRLLASRCFIARSKEPKRSQPPDWLDEALRTIGALIRPPNKSIRNVDESFTVFENAALYLESDDVVAVVRELNRKRTGGFCQMQDIVFVIYGRNKKNRKAMFDFLRAAGLRPLEWEQAVALTGKTSPYVGEVLESALAAAQAVLVLFTGDDLAYLRPDLLESGESEETPTPQPRPNVILEAGMALGKYPDRTLIVEIGRSRAISDLLGRHVIRFDNTPNMRNSILTRLQNAGCAVDRKGDDWMTAGEFDTTGK